MTSEPAIIQKRAIDVTPINHAIWCTVGGSDPFNNHIVNRRWSEDGSKIWFMLDSHNFISALPDELMEVVECRPLYHEALFNDCLARDAQEMAVRPTPPNKCDECGQTVPVPRGAKPMGNENDPLWKRWLRYAHEDLDNPRRT